MDIRIWRKKVAENPDLPKLNGYANGKHGVIGAHVRYIMQGRTQDFISRGAGWRAREREPIMEVWGLCPQRGPGAEPLVGDQGG